MSNENRTRVSIPKTGTHVPEGLRDNVVEISPTADGDYMVYLDGQEVGTVYSTTTSGGRPTHKGSRLVVRNTIRKVWGARGSVYSLGFGVSRTWDTRKAAVWSLVVAHLVAWYQEQEEAQRAQEALDADH